MADAAGPIVEIRRVSKVFQLQDQTIHALSDASLSIAKGEFVCLIGASGCGKSTLLRIMAGFEQPSSGEALMWGKPIAEPDPSRGMVFQDYALFPWLSVRENIAFGPIARGLAGGRVKETVDKFIELVGLGKFANAYPHQLSGGMKQRVAIARVLANDAELVLMDEPFFLANRVVVMTPGPGRIESDNALDLPRPRDVASPEFNAIRRVLGAKLHSHHAKKAA